MLLWRTHRQRPYGDGFRAGRYRRGSRVVVSGAFIHSIPTARRVTTDTTAYREEDEVRRMMRRKRRRFIHHRHGSGGGVNTIEIALNPSATLCKQRTPQSDSPRTRDYNVKTLCNYSRLRIVFRARPTPGTRYVTYYTMRAYYNNRRFTKRTPTYYTARDAGCIEPRENVSPPPPKKNTAMHPRRYDQKYFVSRTCVER